jgi:hypothetical protein
MFRLQLAWLLVLQNFFFHFTESQQIDKVLISIQLASIFFLVMFFVTSSLGYKKIKEPVFPLKALFYLQIFASIKKYLKQNFN